MSNDTNTTNTNGNGTDAVATKDAAAAATGGKREVRIQFLCEKRQVEKREEVPSGLIGQDAARRPHMQPMFERTLRPIVMRHAAEALDACEDKCSSKGCDRDATTIVATPMSVSLGFLVLVRAWGGLRLHGSHPISPPPKPPPPHNTHAHITSPAHLNLAP